MRLHPVLALSAMALLAACHRGPPRRLVPAGAEVLRELPRREEQCYAHRTWVLRAGAAEAQRWAGANDLPCADATTPCTHWSTAARKDPFWKQDDGEPQGLDTVDATLVGAELTVDWGDYTCSGWN
jgi:hypothetical protein